jgi:hypothetical protein
MKHITTEGNSTYAEQTRTGVSKIMETLKPEEQNVFVVATLKELQLATMKFFRLFTFCRARVSAFVIVLSYSPCRGFRKCATCPCVKVRA